MGIVDRIKESKTKLGAIILAHYYQDAAIQDITDFVGDSLDLAPLELMLEWSN